MRLILACFCILASSAVASSQTAIYRGRAYTPESYPKATYCNCATMCPSIRAQWRSQAWVSGYGANKVMATAQPTVAKSTARPATNYKTETRTRTVTKYRTEPYQTRQCYTRNGRRYCRTVTRYRQVPYQATESYQVRVPVAKPEPEKKPEPTAEPKPSYEIRFPDSKPPAPMTTADPPDETPQLVVDAMLAVMGLDESDVLWNIGSGRDARFLVTAAERYGARETDIEESTIKSNMATLWSLITWGQDHQIIPDFRRLRKRKGKH